MRGGVRIPEDVEAKIKAELAKIPHASLVARESRGAWGSSPNARFRPRRPWSEIASNRARCQKAALCSASIGRCESPLTMIAAALTIFRSGLFRAFELIVHLIRQIKSRGYLWTRDPRYWRVIVVTVPLLHPLAARSFPGWAWPRAKHGRRSPTVIIAGRWPGSCANWRA